ncbi:LysE family transporter [Desulfosporosinus fructosivorans]
MIFKGFKLGMILQLAVGPVCLFIFKLGGNKGFIDAEFGVLGVALIDACYIFLAISGITSFIDRERVKHIFRILGAIIVAIFGLQTVLGTFGWEVLPNINLFSRTKLESSFLEGLVLTASNPLTILFWAGVFSTKIVEEKLTRKDVYLFGLGSILATVFFLTVIAAIGSVSRYFLPLEIISILNLIVGVVLIYFAFRIIIKRDK